MIQGRLGYFFISNALQEATKNANILPVFSTDHFTIVFSLFKPKYIYKGKGLWKFNNSLTSNKDLAEKMKWRIS